MNTPNSIHDPELGGLTYDSQLNWYEIRRDTKHGEVSISLGCDEFSDLADLVEELRIFARRIEKVMDAAYEDIASTMFLLKMIVGYRTGSAHSRKRSSWIPSGDTVHRSQ